MGSPLCSGRYGAQPHAFQRLTPMARTRNTCGMSLSLLFACLWVIAATIVAFLPYRAQFPPGIALLIMAPFIIVYMALDHGLLVGLIGVAAFVSMFRNPLIYFWRKARGTLPPQADPQDEKGA